MANAWDRKHDEAQKAWGAFVVYRDLGPFERSLTKAAELLGKTAKYKRSVELWSSQHSWVARARAWDAHQDELRQRRLTKELEGMAERHAQTASRMLELADLKLQGALRDVSILAKATGGQTLDVTGLRLSDLPALVKVAAELERISRGAQAADQKQPAAAVFKLVQVDPATGEEVPFRGMPALPGPAGGEGSES